MALALRPAKTRTARLRRTTQSLPKNCERMLSCLRVLFHASDFRCLLHLHPSKSVNCISEPRPTQTSFPQSAAKPATQSQNLEKVHSLQSFQSSLPVRQDCFWTPQRSRKDT